MHHRRTRCREHHSARGSSHLASTAKNRLPTCPTWNPEHCTCAFISSMHTQTCKPKTKTSQTLQATLHWQRVHPANINSPAARPTHNAHKLLHAAATDAQANERNSQLSAGNCGAVPVPEGQQPLQLPAAFAAQQSHTSHHGCHNAELFVHTDRKNHSKLPARNGRYRLCWGIMGQKEHNGCTCCCCWPSLAIIIKPISNTHLQRQQCHIALASLPSPPSLSLVGASFQFRQAAPHGAADAGGASPALLLDAWHRR